MSGSEPRIKLDWKGIRKKNQKDPYFDAVIQPRITFVQIDEGRKKCIIAECIMGETGESAI